MKFLVVYQELQSEHKTVYIDSFDYHKAALDFIKDFLNDKNTEFRFIRLIHGALLVSP